jgi:hypothetical protein
MCSDGNDIQRFRQSAWWAHDDQGCRAQEDGRNSQDETEAFSTGLAGNDSDFSPPSGRNAS